MNKAIYQMNCVVHQDVECAEEKNETGRRFGLTGSVVEKQLVSILTLEFITISKYPLVQKKGN
jgi:hypothetical protein